MDAKEFLDAAKAKERAEFEKKRDEHLISLGLINEEESKCEYSDRYDYTQGNILYDAKLDKYYKGVKVPLQVSDEEYEEILKFAPTTVAINEDTLNNGAEKFLGTINTIILVVSIIAAVSLAIYAMYWEEGALFLIGLGVLLVGLISWAIVKVMLNISNNLHKINSKLK